MDYQARKPSSGVEPVNMIEFVLELGRLVFRTSGNHSYATQLVETMGIFTLMTLCLLFLLV